MARTSPIRNAKNGLRALLAGITYAKGYAATIAWQDHGPNPAEAPDPESGDDVAATGEIVADKGDLDEENSPHGHTDELVLFAVVLNISVSDAAAMTADDYADDIAADIQEVAQADRTWGGTVQNSTYAGWEKRDIEGSTAIRALIVKFTARVRYAFDAPYHEQPTAR